MSAARDALVEGRLGEALELQSAAVATHPGDSPARLFLFELLTIAGRRAEALVHLEGIQSDDPAWPDVRHGFEQLLRAQARREPVLRMPRFLADPPAHVSRRWNCTINIRRGNPERARRWLDAADTATPEVRGFVDGREFLGMRDSDDRLASLFELYLGGRCCWVPFEEVARLELHPRRFAMDGVVRPATLTLKDGRTSAAALPLTYPNSAAAGDDFALGLTADWNAHAGVVVGTGAKVLHCGDEELELGDCRLFEFG